MNMGQKLTIVLLLCYYLLVLLVIITYYYYVFNYTIQLKQALTAES